MAANTGSAPRPSTAGDVLGLVRGGQARTRSEVATLTGLSRTAVTSRVDALVAAGLLLAGAEVRGTGGRPAGSLAFNHRAGAVLAIAVGRSRSQLGVHDLEGRLLTGDSSDHPVGVGAHELMPHLASRARALLAEADGPLLAIGMSLPGQVDPTALVSLDSPVMRGWDGVPLAPYLTGIGEVPVFLVSDTHALAHSELVGTDDPPAEALVVKASTGLGVGLISHGRVLTGHSGSTGEIGHTRSPRAEGMACRCGEVGCLEAVAGGWALVARYAESGGRAEHVRDLAARAVEGEPEARRLLRSAGRDLGEALAAAVNLLNPGHVVLGGDMASTPLLFDTFAAGVRESLYAGASARNAADLVVRPATHGDRAGLVGCAAVALDGLLDPARVDALLASR